MKFKFLAFAAVAALIATGCQKTGSSSALTENDSAKADSMMYYFGKLRALEYFQEAQADTTLKEAASKAEYLHGIQTGIQVFKDSKNAYNQGVFLGLQLAMNISQFKDEYGVQLPTKALVNSIKESLDTDSVPDAAVVQREFYRLMQQFNEAKEEKEKKEAKEALETKAKELKMVAINDNLYSEQPNVKKENALKEGDKVTMNLEITGPDGNTLNSPFPQDFSLGSRFRENPLQDALLTLAPGESGKFATTAGAIFGPRVQHLGLKSADVLVFTLKPELIAPEEEEAK